MRLALATHPRIRGVYACGLAALLGIAGCATAPSPPPVSGPPPVAETETLGRVIARNDRFVLYSTGPEDTLASVARRFLGTEKRQWEIADFNAVSRAEPGTVLAIPLRPTNPKGVVPEGYQTVPILCYHRVGSRTSRMVIAPDTFAAQLDYLARNGYRVIRLSDLVDFLQGKGQLPKRAVVITFDDAHISAYQHAYPLLKKYGFPATMFLYTDFLGAKEALNWTQMQEMARSGLIDFQAHSKTHSNLIVRLPGESDQHYRERVDLEIRVPRDLIQRHLSTKVTDYAYPYGDANELVLERLAHADYRLGLTVNPGGNPFFAHPLMLRRTMIFGEHGMDAFKAALQVFKEVNLR